MDKIININKKIINNNTSSKYFDEVLLYTINDFSIFNSSLDYVFTSKPQKNDIPSIYKVNNYKSKVLSSDSLTIIGNDKCAIFIEYYGVNYLIRTDVCIKDHKVNEIRIYVLINRELMKNEEIDFERVSIYESNNINESIKKFAKEKGELFNASTKERPIVFNTWYYYKDKFSIDDITTNLDNIKEKNIPINTFEIDDGWMDFIGDYNINNRLDTSLEDLSKLIKSYGLIPGIWTAPFLVDRNSLLFKDHFEWLLKDKDNKLIRFNVNKKNYYILDITIDAVRGYIINIYKKLNEYGFKFFKIDFTRAIFNKNAKYYNSNVSVVSIYRELFKQVKNNISSDSYILMCGGLFDPLIGIVDGQRTGSDSIPYWKNRFIPNKNIPNRIRQNIYRYYMSYWWNNDSDTLILRDNKKEIIKNDLSRSYLKDNEVKTILLNEYISGGIISLTEDLNTLSIDRLNMFNKIIDNKNEVQILNLFDSFNSFIIKCENNIILINLNDKCNTFNINNEAILVEPHSSVMLKYESGIYKEAF